MRDMQEKTLEEISDEFFALFKIRLKRCKNHQNLVHTPTNLKQIQKLNGHYDSLDIYKLFISRHRTELEKLGYRAPLPDMLETIAPPQSPQKPQEIEDQLKNKIIEYAE